ncbi:MAG: alpha/beta fold hydrolase [Microgenomates group bacterium]
MKTNVFRIILVCLIIGVGGIFGWLVFPKENGVLISPLSMVKEKPLEKYSILRLASREFIPSPIVLSEPTATTSAYTVYPFSFVSDGKKVTGIAHIPISVNPEKTFPVVVQLRGYVDREIYTPGMGTTHSAEVYAKNGYISFAPDFLGYGGSDAPSLSPIEERLETYTTALTLLASVPRFPHADPTRIGLWGHSNGGQIALTLLTVLGDRAVPTAVWAPVTKPFPYNILYYTDEFDDRGKALRKVVADFEADYDADLYSMTQYLDRIAVPIQLSQGTNDDAVPFAWSDSFVELLEEKKTDVTYYIYSGADHNLAGGDAWNSAMGRDMQFFAAAWK